MNTTSKAPGPTGAERKRTLLLVLIGGFFVANALIAEFIGVKVFSLERTLGFSPLDWPLTDSYRLSLNISAGVLLWPLEFSIADLINEYFGQRGIKLLSYLAVGFIGYAFVMIAFAIWLTPADFWILRQTDQGPLNMDLAFDAVFSQGMWIIAGSLVAFLVGQLLDVRVFHLVKRYTGEGRLWLRATGSTFVSQLVDSFIVLAIAFHFNPATQWELKTILLLGLVKYFYKFIMAILLTPLIYLLHRLIDNYLGEPLATEMKREAMSQSRTASGV